MRLRQRTLEDPSRSPEAGSPGSSPGLAPCADEVPDELVAHRERRFAGPPADPRPAGHGRRVRELSSGLRRRFDDAGMATAEYAIATLAAVGFAGLLVVILKSNEVRGLLSGIVRRALTL